MKKLIVLSLLVLLVLNVSGAISQSKQNYAKQNTWEAGGSVSWFSMTPVYNGKTDDAVSILLFAPYGGYFVTDGFEIGIKPTIGYISSDDDHMTAFAVYLSPAYNFYTNSIAYPYLQGSIGYNSLAGSNMTTSSGIAWDFEGGVKINVFGNSLLKFGLNYGQQTLETSSHTGGRNGYNNFSFTAGFNVFFK